MAGHRYRISLHPRPPAPPKRRPAILHYKNNSSTTNPSLNHLVKQKRYTSTSLCEGNKSVLES